MSVRWSTSEPVFSAALGAMRAIAPHGGFAPYKDAKNLMACAFLKLGRIWGRARTRRALAALDARLLDDIGITAQMADEEVRKVPWQC
ncbi:MAG: hypothetical protein ACI8PT_002952 [Gammaproteobacteria bacterium]|jgi:uncharacterized protein YjiS (DUF1127 family)